MDSNSRDKMENAESLGIRPEKGLLTWQLKALLAERTPLPNSRPKRKSDETESPESEKPESKEPKSKKAKAQV